MNIIHELLDFSSSTGSSLDLRTIKIPLHPPLNADQAETWTKSLWPVTYNPAAPRAVIAPPPQVLNRVRDSIQPYAERYLDLARQVAQETEGNGTGRCVGAVAVDPSILQAAIGGGDDDDDETNGGKWLSAVVAVAGDARYSRREGGSQSQAERHAGLAPNPATKVYNADLEGGPELHALMRVIDMVARRRRDEEEEVEGPSSQRLSDLESRFLYASDDLKGSSSASSPGKHPTTAGGKASQILPRSQGGYLCTDLDLYITHEPCLCCSMGLILSRFRAAVFPRQGRMLTGGLASESVVVRDSVRNDKGKDDDEDNRIYYGLHWRRELNWRALAFEFVEDPCHGSAARTSFKSHVDFHA